MTARRLAPALLTSFLLAASFTWVLSRRMTRPVHAATPVAAMEHLVAARGSMAVGDTLTPDKLTTTDWPAASVPPSSFQRPGELTGRVLVVPVAAGQPLLGQYLAATGTGAGLPARIPAGMRAVTVHADDVAGDAGFVTPDSFVDVLATVHTNGDADAATTCILNDVRVLAVGQKTDAEPGGKPSTAGQNVTLLLRPDDAQKLAQAVALGKLQLLLRNGADREQVAVGAVHATAQRSAGMAPTAPVGSASAALGSVLPRSGGHAASSAQNKEFTVETVYGGSKQSGPGQGAPSLEGKPL